MSEKKREDIPGDLAVPLAARTGPEWRGESQGFQRHVSPVNAIS